MERCRKRLEEELSCSLCLEYFKDPVTLDCGHNFCRICLTNYWGESPTDTACPLCRDIVQVKRLKPNRQLGNVIEITKDMDDLLKHCFVSVEEAAQDSKDQMSGSLKFLKKERKNIVVNKSMNKTESQVLLKQMQKERQKTTTAFRDLRQFLEDQEKHLLDQMDEVEEEIRRRRDDYQDSLSTVLSNFDCLIHELEEKLKQSAGELMQNYRNILERCPKEQFNNPVAFPVALKWKIHDLCDVSPFLEGLIEPFQDSLKTGLPLKQVNVTLDPDTANPRIILSKNLKAMRWEAKNQLLPYSPKRFDYWSYVLGSEEFKAGRFFWDVTVGSEEMWFVGVAKNSVERKGKVNCGTNEGIWALGKWQGRYRVCKPGASLYESYSSISLNQNLKRIRVTLNCPGGRVAFLNGDTGQLLYVYTDPSLHGQTLHPIFYVSEKGHLTLGP